MIFMEKLLEPLHKLTALEMLAVLGYKPEMPKTRKSAEYLDLWRESISKGAMINEANIRATDALDRLVRLDRDNAVAFIREYLNNLTLYDKDNES